MPIHIKIQEAAKLYELFKTGGTNYDRAMDSGHWIHPSKHIPIAEEQERTPHALQVFTDGSKSETGVGAGIAVFEDTNLIATQKFRLNGRCTNNQAEQLAILQALEYIRSRQDAGKTSTIFTDSRITLQLLTNHKRRTNLFDKIRNKVMELERSEIQVLFRWIKAHSGREGNELLDRLAKEASTDPNIEEC